MNLNIKNVSQVYFEVAGKPQGKERPKFSVQKGRAIAYTPQKTRDYEQLIRAEYTSHRKEFFPRGTPLGVDIVAVFPIPVGWSQKKKAMAINQSIYPVVRPDEDNISKIVKDALNKVAYADDAQIVSSHVTKIYGEKPCIRVWIYNMMAEEKESGSDV